MKIYFAGSIRGGRDDAKIYKEIIEIIVSLGHQVLTEHVGLKTTKAMGEVGRTESWIYNRDMTWLKQSDVVVAEVTNPSLGVGYEIASAENLNKPVLVLFRPSSGRKLSAMIGGSPYLKVVEYKKVSDLDQVIKNFIAGL